jgi:hypothetical protein
MGGGESEKPYDITERVFRYSLDAIDLFQKLQEKRTAPVGLSGNSISDLQPESVLMLKKLRRENRGLTLSTSLVLPRRKPGKVCIGSGF